MASNQPTQAVIVVPNDDINIPEPGVYKSGTNTGAGVNLVVNPGTGNFITGDVNPGGTGYSNKVAGGDVVYEPSTGTIAQVIEVTGEDTLTLSTPPLTALPTQMRSGFGITKNFCLTISTRFLPWEIPGELPTSRSVKRTAPGMMLRGRRA